MDGGDEREFECFVFRGLRVQISARTLVILVAFSGAFTKLREATVSFVVSVRPRGSLTGRIFMKFNI